MIHVDKVLCHGENGGATRDTVHRGCIMRKVVGKEVTAGGRFDFFLDSGFKLSHALKLLLIFHHISGSCFYKIAHVKKCCNVRHHLSS